MEGKALKGSTTIDVAFAAGFAFRDNSVIRYSALGMVGYRGD